MLYLTNGSLLRLIPRELILLAGQLLLTILQLLVHLSDREYGVIKLRRLRLGICVEMHCAFTKLDELVTYTVEVCFLRAELCHETRSLFSLFISHSICFVDQHRHAISNTGKAAD